MTTDKIRINCLRTGVPGLDEVLGGGLPEFSFNLIAGSPGCGKTVLAHQMMFALATPERSAIYFTVLGEPPLKMLRYQQQFEFFDPEKVNRSIRFIGLGEEASSGNLDLVLERITKAVEEIRPAFVFVDSFRSVVLSDRSSQDDGGYSRLQHFIQRLGMQLTAWQATTFLLGEYFSDNDPNPVFTVADGLIWLRQTRQSNSVVRQMEIIKMRGQATVPGLHTFRIGAAGIHVFAPPLAAPPSTDAGPMSPPDKRLRMGTPGLDEMMGGGLPVGHSLLVAGPSGSGKSILASAFLVEGACNGEHGVIAAFEQRSNRSRGRPIVELIEKGMISTVDTRALTLSVDEISEMLITEIRRVNASRIVIDSLSGFELALAPTFRADFRESMSRMVSALATTGATVLFTSELEDRYIDLRFSPYGTAFLTDSIIVQRYIEVDSQLQRVMAVVKVRASAHSNELRSYTIGENGIIIGDMLKDREGLLGGRPTQRLTEGVVPTPSDKGLPIQ